MYTIYLLDRKEVTNINSVFSSWEEFLFGILELFNISLCDFVFVISNYGNTGSAEVYHKLSVMMLIKSFQSSTTYRTNH